MLGEVLPDRPLSATVLCCEVYSLHDKLSWNISTAALAENMAFCHHFQDCYWHSANGNAIIIQGLIQGGWIVWNGNAICHVMKYYNVVGLHYITKVTTLWLNKRCCFCSVYSYLVHATNCLPNKIVATMICPCNSIVGISLFPEIPLITLIINLINWL